MFFVMRFTARYEFKDLLRAMTPFLDLDLFRYFLCMRILTTNRKRSYVNLIERARWEGNGR